MTNADPLSVVDLAVGYVVRGISLEVVHGVEFTIGQREAYGLVGESGCGKSTVAFAVMRHLAKNAFVKGRILLDGTDVLGLDEQSLRSIRGRTLSMVYQDPSSALTPTMRIGDQVAEVYQTHFACNRHEAMERVREMLEKVSISDAGHVMRRYPHQLSGGQQQRIVIAMGLAAEPKVLIMDEPTTALDATVEAEVLSLVGGLRSQFNTALLFISHNLRVVLSVCDRVGVLYGGYLVEEGPASELFGNPRHPYTAGLVGCVPRAGMNKRTARLAPIPGRLPALGAAPHGCVFRPRCHLATSECNESPPPPLKLGDRRMTRCFHPDDVAVATVPATESRVGDMCEKERARLLAVRGVWRSFHDVTPCEDISLEICKGETIGVVGESGSGKTTLARCVAGLVKPDAGEIILNGKPLALTISARSREEKATLQMVFQNPQMTLNPRHTAKFILGRAIRKLRGSRSTSDLARDIQLGYRQLTAVSGGLSGGEKQRVAIGRALAGNPSVVICDEPVSSLDVSVQASILNLLAELSERDGLSYLFISHDLAVVRYLSDRIAVMYLGQLVEQGPSDAVFRGPRHPYTDALLAAAPPLGCEIETNRLRLDGSPPSLMDPPPGCRFHVRCQMCLGDPCKMDPPPWQQVDDEHWIRCHTSPERLEAAQVSRDVAS